MAVLLPASCMSDGGPDRAVLRAWCPRIEPFVGIDAEAQGEMVAESVEITPENRERLEAQSRQLRERIEAVAASAPAPIKQDTRTLLIGDPSGTPERQVEAREAVTEFVKRHC